MSVHKLTSVEKKERPTDSEQVISQIMERLHAAYNFLPQSLKSIADKVLSELQELLQNPNKFEKDSKKWKTQIEFIGRNVDAIIKNNPNGYYKNILSANDEMFDIVA